MTKEQLAEATANFTASGRKIQAVAEGERTIDLTIRHCRCGCHGNWTNHTMRAGESGRRTD